VISIVALLVAILLPALTTARNAARSVACLAMQRQMVLGLTTYTTENSGAIPMATSGATGPTPVNVAAMKQWRDIFIDDFGFDERGGSCPEAGPEQELVWNDSSKSFVLNADGSTFEYDDAYHYAINATFTGTANNVWSHRNDQWQSAWNVAGVPGLKQGNIDNARQPSKLAIFLETSRQGWFGSSNMSGQSFRHHNNNAMNLGMFDGHAQTVRIEDGKESPKFLYDLPAFDYNFYPYQDES